MSEALQIACRLCLEENCRDHFYDLHLDEGNNRSSKALAEIFRINVEDDATLPNRICLDCNDRLLNLYDFYLEVMKNQAKLMLDLNSHPKKNESPQPSNIVDSENPPELQTASQDSRISTSTRRKRRKRQRRGSTHRDRELTPLSTESEDDELPLSVLVRRPSEQSNSQKFTCQECSEEFTKIYLYETHKETVHSSYPVDASPNIDTIKIITHSGNENVLKFKCKLCAFQSESQWETRRHQSTTHNATNSQPNGQKLLKILSLNAVAERILIIKKKKNLTPDQRLKTFYGFSCSRCKPPMELPTLAAFEKHAEETHNLTDIAWLCCDVKWRHHQLKQHLNYHLGVPQVVMKRDNFLFQAGSLKAIEIVNLAEIDLPSIDKPRSSRTRQRSK
ncbi:uncharacterized protein LOC134835842 [Culicoides brevitarsis]|uniref:uncharacterized protein LOC134835842 n=1 Tax=Culicoides brevitarsis TaxID=469753 RepID=UPI00307C8581